MHGKCVPPFAHFYKSEAGGRHLRPGRPAGGQQAQGDAHALRCRVERLRAGPGLRQEALRALHHQQAARKALRQQLQLLLNVLDQCRPRICAVPLQGGDAYDTLDVSNSSEGTTCLNSCICTRTTDACPLKIDQSSVQRQCGAFTPYTMCDWCAPAQSSPATGSGRSRPTRRCQPQACRAPPPLHPHAPGVAAPRTGRGASARRWRCLR